MILRALAAAAALAAPATSAHAQTAGDLNRMNAALQICNSAVGAALAECARLRGQSGGAGLGGAAGAVGILGSVLGAARASAPAPAAPPVDSARIRDGVAGCVQRAAGDAAAVQACLAQASAPAAAPFRGLPHAPTLGRAPAGDTATAIHQAGQSYQACAAANPSNWRSCLPLLNGAPR